MSDMRRFWLPDYEKKLIAELQRQQNNSQFCDTLLQTEGISIPTHSSVVGALSVPLSQRLSACPAPAAGQKRRLHLHTVKSQTLIKLVGLLYSGECEVNGATEQQDVLAATQLFGLPDVIEEDKFQIKCSAEFCKEPRSVRVDNEKKDVQTQVTLTSFYVSTGTQTVTEDTDQSIKSSQHLKSATASSVLSSSLSEKNTSKTSSKSTCPDNSRECSGGECVHEHSANRSASATSCGPSKNKMRLCLSPSESSNYSRLQQGDVTPSLPGTSAVLTSDGSGVDENEQIKLSESTKRTNHENTGKGPLVEIKQASKSAARKNLAKMQEMMETTQISFKMKLRRRQTKDDTWEVVKNTNALAGPASLKLDNKKSRQGDHEAFQPSPLTAVVCHTVVPQPIINSPQQHTCTETCIPQSDPGPAPLPAPRPAEETDEQIDKLLEDIMIGLNILPNIEKGHIKPQDGDLSQKSCLVQKNKASNSVCYEEYGTQNLCSATDKALHSSGSTVQDSTELSVSNSSLNETLENSSVSARTDGPQNSQSSPCCSESRDSNPQEDPNVLALLPLSTENEVNLFSMADLQFLPCLSPIDSNNNGTNGNKTLTSLRGKPWLAGDHCLLEFPLNYVAEKLKHSPTKPSSADDIKENTRSTEADGPNAQICQELKAEKDTELQNAIRKFPTLRRSTTCRNLSSGASCNLSHCLVSLSSNNVLAKDRKNNSSETDQQTATSRSRRPTTKLREDGLLRTPIRTRRKSQETQGMATASIPNPDACRNVRKRERRRKCGTNAEESKQQIEKPASEQTNEARPKTRKRRRKEENVSEQAPSLDNSVDGDHPTPTPKKPCTISLKEFQDLIKRQHLKAQREKEPSDNSERNDVGESSPIQEAWNSPSDAVDETDACDAESGSASLLNQSRNSPKTPPRADNFEKNNSSKVSDQSESCVSLIPEEDGTPKLSEGVTGSSSENDTGQSSPIIIRNRTANERAGNRPKFPKSENRDEGAVEELKPSDERAGCPQDDEEEVDVLLHSSPDQAPLTAEGHRTGEVSPDEEDEEESNEVDVTGSETDA